jgi:hypothetical protein
MPIFMSYSKGQIILVFYEVGKSHEGWSFVLAEVGTYSTRIPPSPSIKKNAKLVIGNFFIMSTDFAKKVYHIDGKFEFHFNYLY